MLVRFQYEVSRINKTLITYRAQSNIFYKELSGHQLHERERAVHYYCPPFILPF